MFLGFLRFKKVSKKNGNDYRPKARSKEPNKQKRHIHLDETLNFVIADVAETYQPPN